MTRRSGPKAASPEPRRQAQFDTPKGTTPPPADPDYDDEAPELEGYESDPLTADAWAALCLAADRGELAEVDG